MKNMFKVMLFGLGMGVAATAYATSCGQCVRQLEVCDYYGQPNCAQQFEACLAQVDDSRCWFP